MSAHYKWMGAKDVDVEYLPEGWCVKGHDREDNCDDTCILEGGGALVIGTDTIAVIQGSYPDLLKVVENMLRELAKHPEEMIA